MAQLRRINTSIPGPSQAVAKVMDAALAIEPDLIPNLSGEELMVFSDYSGSHQGSPYEVYSFLFANHVALGKIAEPLGELRRSVWADGRRISYKELRDRMRARHLPTFLDIITRLEGIVCSVAVSAALGNLGKPLSPEERLDPALAAEIRSYSNPTRERTTRVLHFLCGLLASLSTPNQNITWVTDEDEIIANKKRRTSLEQFYSNLLSQYLTHNVGSLSIHSTGDPTDSLVLEDLTAIPDLYAGALADMLANSQNRHDPQSRQLVVPLGPNVARKANYIGTRCFLHKCPLRQIAITIEPGPTSESLRVSRRSFHVVSQGLWRPGNPLLG